MTEGYSLSDIATVTGNGGNNGVWGNSSIWIIILFLFCFAGLGNGIGFGGGQSGQSVYEGYVLQNDFSQLSNQVSRIGDGISSLGYEQLGQMNGINQNISNTGFNVINAINGLSSQMASCCCETQRAIDGINYNMATQACDTRNVIQSATRDIINNQNCNTQRIVDLMTTNEIQSLRDQLQGARFAMSQQAQTASIVAQLTPAT